MMQIDSFMAHADPSPTPPPRRVVRGIAPRPAPRAVVAEIENS